jgi:hypothetical protein
MTIRQVHERIIIEKTPLIKPSKELQTAKSKIKNKMGKLKPDPEKELK